MRSAKIAITLDDALVHRLDRLVGEGRFNSRSRIVQEAVREKLDRLDRTRLARECAKLDPAEEKRLAEEGLMEDLKTWPEY
jgi:Arc/MetJ-type ribon-helix-helix transcriptional regulator